MKNKIKIYLVLLLAVIYACDDPYKDSTFTVYDEMPIASYLDTRPEDFSEWIQILKYTDMYNALNQSSEVYTAFVPTNRAVYTFYENKNVSSVEELGVIYARELVKYHIMRDSVSLDEFTAGGMLINQTLTEDYLEVTFSDEWEDESGFDALYLNGEAHVAELAIGAANGLVYVLDDVMRPMIESVYEQMREEGKNAIMLEAIRLTGWNNSLEIISDTVTLSTGATSIQRRYYTVLAVPDEVYEANSITSAESLASRLGAGSDYTNPDNALYRYIGYHILQASYKVDDLQSFDQEDDVCKLWETAATNTLIKSTLESDGNYYFNYEGGSNFRASLRVNESDIMVKNGYFHQLTNIMPVPDYQMAPVPVCFEVTVYPELASYISANGDDGQIYQGMVVGERTTNLPEDIGCYEYEVSPMGSVCIWGGPVAYWTARSDNPNELHKALHKDALLLSMGYKGNVTMKTPPILPGKYKVSMHYIYVTSMNPFRICEGSNGGQTTFEFTDMVNVKPVNIPVYAAIESDTLDFYMIDLFEEVTFDTLSSHLLKITLQDPAASTSINYRILIDYILFEPID